MRVRWQVVLLSALAPALVSAQAKRPLVIEDYYRVKTVANPRISPNGQWVLYTISARVEADNSTVTETRAVRTDGAQQPVHVQHSAREITNAQWTERGLLRYRADSASWVLDLDAARRQPRREDGNWTAGLPSPDGKWLASTPRVPATQKASTFTSEFERRHEERFRGLQFDWLNYKRDGARAPVPDPRDPVATPPAEIVITSTADESKRTLTQLGLQAANLEWKPDGSAIVFTANPHYRDELKYGGTQLFLATLEGEVRRLTDDDYVYSNPAFSPDGSQIAFTRTYSTDLVIAQKLDHGGPRDLLVMPSAGGSARNLSEQWDLEPGAAMWSPNGRHIYFAAAIGGENHLFRVPAAGGPVEQITRGPRRLTGITIDRGFRKIAYLVGVFERPADVYVANIDGSGERRLTDVNADFMNTVELARTERVSYASADGTPIEGWLVYPVGYQPERGPYPLIVSNHGGPHSAVGYGFDFKDQLFAANGYFVLETNFRSSTGYGEKFKWGTWGAWGTKDGQDVMAGIDHVLSKYPIDRARVGTTGHSYGGFMTNWLITQYPDRFAAAVSGAGISNWISDYGLADIARTKETEFYGKPWEPGAREIMIRQSPLFYADRVRTPTLFIHGEVDYRVPYSEAEQFYFALKKNGVPARIIQYEDQPHGIGGHWNNVHRMLNELRWWNTYLRSRSSSRARGGFGGRGVGAGAG